MHSTLSTVSLIGAFAIRHGTLSYFSFAAAEFSAEASAPEAAEEPTALYELTELRQANTKYIQMSDGTGTDYSNNNLTSAVVNPILRRQHPMVNAMAQGIANGRTELQEPYYGYDNGVRGLTLAIDSWYGNKFEIVSFNKSGNSYSGTLRFSFYDHFGLDTSDLEDKKYGNMQAGFLSGFRQWYILQHWSGLAAAVQPKPFVTKVSFTIPFQGTYN